MQTKYRGILLYLKVHKENDLLVKFLSNSDELISGIVYGGLSKKKRNIFQIGYFLDFEVSYKSNRPSSINAELSKPFISKIINDKYKLNCLICVTSLINLSIIEGQKIKNIFYIVENFLLNMFNNKKWFADFCSFLFQLLKIIGYEIDYLEAKNKKYFDLDLLEFKNVITKTSVEFPYHLLDKNNVKIDTVNVINFFNIFETVYLRNHLSNFNLRLPNQYYLFKKLIIYKIK